MDQLLTIRNYKHKEYLLTRRKEELMTKLSSYLEFNEFKRKICIISNFFLKYYKKKYVKSKLVSLSHLSIDTISGVRRKHLKNRRTNIVIDLIEFDLIKKQVPRSFHKQCLCEIKKINSVVFMQNYDFSKCSYQDSKLGIGFSNESIEALYSNNV